MADINTLRTNTTTAMANMNAAHDKVHFGGRGMHLNETERAAVTDGTVSKHDLELAQRVADMNQTLTTAAVTRAYADAIESQLKEQSFLGTAREGVKDYFNEKHRGDADASVGSAPDREKGQRRRSISAGAGAAGR